MCFSHHLERGLGAGQLRGEFLVLAAQPLVSTSCALRAGRPAGLGASSFRPPLSRVFRQSEIWPVVIASRRKIAPRSPGPACSYSARIFVLYAAVNVRRCGLPLLPT